MGFRVVEQSSFVFMTDIPPLRRGIHPSGVVHAYRPSSNRLREKHLFAWVANSLKVGSFLQQLARRGFDRSRGIVFIPYSTKENWRISYPSASLSMECTEGGEVKTLPTKAASGGDDGEGTEDSEWGKRKKRKYYKYETSRRAEKCSTKTDASGEDRILQAGQSSNGEDGGGGGSSGGGGGVDHSKNDKTEKIDYITRASRGLKDAERDELHIEIYRYLKWLHSSLSETEERERLAAELELEKVSPSDAEIDDDEDTNGPSNERSLRKRRAGSRKGAKVVKGVSTPELRRALDKLESAFPVIPVIANEGEEAYREEGRGTKRRGAPFLEFLGPALTQLVDARQRAGWPRRRRMERKSPVRDWGKNYPTKFEETLERMERYHEKNGDCLVYRTEDPELYDWAQAVREKRTRLLERGIEFEEVCRGKPLTATMLTAERIRMLDDIGFVWSIGRKPVQRGDGFRQQGGKTTRTERPPNVRHKTCLPEWQWL